MVIDSVREAALTETPRNTVALAGDKVVLHCSTDAQGGDGKRIQWLFGTQRLICRPKREQCNLIIDSVRTSDAGAYECSDGSLRVAQSSLIVIGNHIRNLLNL